MLYSINHPNIIKIIGYYKDEHYYYIATPYYKKGSIAKIVKSIKSKNNSGFSESNVRNISKKILNAIDYLHSSNPPIVHRDIKGDNILLNDSDEPILADFGLSYLAIENNTNFKTACCSPFWAAPEILNKSTSDFSRKCDIYSFGCTILEMIVGSDPWGGKRNHQSHSPPIPTYLTLECKEVLNETLKYNQNFRADSKQLLESQWFKETSLRNSSNGEIIFSSEDIMKEFKKNGSTIQIGPVKQEYKYKEQFDIENISKWPREPSFIDPKHKNYKEVLNLYDHYINHSPFMAKIGPYVLDLKEELNEKTFYKSLAISSILGKIDKYEPTTNQNLIPSLFFGFINFVLYQTIKHYPSKFRIL